MPECSGDGWGERGRLHFAAAPLFVVHEAAPGFLPAVHLGYAARPYPTAEAPQGRPYAGSTTSS